ncbi:hypothetical protein N431DRAFT_20353 [Stipitochalara longipes BDJ]|nr:hypothetical protein N431DRAFT_20353 [Stipitochalara longipes BDJ]
MHLPPNLLLTALLLLFPSPSLTQSCSGVGYRDVCCPGLIIGTSSNANNLDGLTCCDGDPTHAIQIGLSSCTAGTSVAMTVLASVSGGVSAGSTTSNSVEGSMTTQGGGGVTGKGPKTSVMGSGSTTILTGTSDTSATSTTATIETVGGTSTSTTASSTAGGAMITQGPLLLVGGAAALFAYGVM